MADVITRFKLETTQYDSKLRDASKALADYTRQASVAGNEFGKFTQANVEAARAFGNIATSATNSKDKVKELVGAFNDVARQYNALTKEQQQSDFGKALAESMTTLKGRISEAKAEMNSSGGILDAFAKKITVNFDAVKLLNMGLEAAKTALNVAKDAFFASESNVDEWGRTIAGAQSLYEGFLTAINNGDISGYLTRMDEIVKAARAAYDELDKLGTMKTIQAPQISAQQTENERIRMMIQTGRYIAPVDGRKNAVWNGKTMQNGQLLTPEQIRRLEGQLQGGMQKMVGLVGNEVKQTGKAIDAYYNSLAKQNGMTMKEFREGTSSWAEFSKKMAGYDAYKEWDKNARTEYAKQGGRGYVNFDKNNPYAEFRKWGTFRVDKQGDNSYNELVNLIKQRDQQSGQLYSTLSQSYRAINRAEGITLKKIMGGGGSGGSGGGNGNTGPTYDVGSLAEAQADVQRLTKLWNEAGADVRNQYLQPLIEAEQKVKDMQNAMTLAKEQAQGKLNGVNLWRGDIDDITGGKAPQFANTLPDLSKTLQLDNLPQHLSPLQQLNAELARLKELLELAPNTEAYQAGLQAIADKEKEIAQFKGTSKLGKDAESSAKSFQMAANAISQVGSAMSTIEDPTMKIMGIVAQAVASVALGFSQATTAEAGKGVYAWIAAIAGGMATMYSTIESIHSATGYAEGGIIKGNSYSGDKIGGVVDGSQFVGLNAGELVLNASQQSMLANNLQNGGGGKMEIVGVLTGENVVLMADRWGRRTGRGELLFGKNL